MIDQKSSTPGRCYLLGHAHIDAAWLWPSEETVKVCRDTFKSVLELMRKCPQLRFCQSSAQYYAWMEERYPELFDEIRARVREGLWEIVGGSWVEFDCNIPSGESMVRQFLYGKRYFRERLGVDVRVGWLPDSFGFCWTLPQIMKGCGVEYFLTQKLRWNDMVGFPYNVFYHRGPDGSRVLACQTVGSYSERLVDERRLLTQLGMLRIRHGIEDLLVLFGRGDHGGGPTDEDLENALRWMRRADLPEMSFSTALEYFRRLEELDSGSFPTVDGELYLQFHRGTYTTQAKVKLKNRKAEIALENAEKMATFASRYGLRYPREELEGAWKRLLFNQFHDIISGSSIKEVCEEADRDYDEVLRVAEGIVEEAARLISSCAGTKAAPSVIVFNTLSWVRDGVVEVDLGGVEGLGEVRVEDCDGVALPHQVVDGKLVFIGRRIPALGFKEFKLVGGRRAEVPRTDLTVLESDGAIALENSHVRVTVDRRTGHITSIYDKANGREVISPGEGVSLQVYDDNRVGGRKPLYEVFDAVLCDAWEIYIYQQPGGLRCVELSDPESVEVIERGPVRSTVRVRYRYRQEGRRDSLFNVDVTLYSGTPLVILRLGMDWHALHRLVKTAFPLNVGSDYATYEIPYGSIRRRNPLSPQATLSERAKWEAPGQKWVDCSDGGEAYGVSILNDCKYGFDQANNVIRVTLLRSPSYPPKWPIGRAEDFLYEGKPTDQGHHEVGMAIYPHKGDWREALTVRRAYEFNYPLITCLRREPSGGAGKAGSHSFIRAEPENVVLTVVKRAEGSDDVILRFYETNGRGADAVISFDVEPVAVYEVNLIEEEISRLAVQGNFVRIPVGPHEIKTLKVRFPAKAR